MRRKEETIGVIEAVEVKWTKRSAVEIECRLKNMLQQFKIISKEKDAAVQIKWKFYETLSSIMTSKAEVTVDTSENVEKNK
jgi:hypothetical protein